ncbi:MAG: hypothetical protein IJO61_08055 [Oscillospiraceae bacterium]|nr:hypothetical protein [Oscillospiraceae bacterium]MBQ6847068.1 hypothetical protein [Oscillospiraceae bacterium]MBQ7120380.1 hypothetical protein [Oscillospiraceae bacterium]
MNFNSYMYEIVEKEIQKGLADGKKMHCKAFLKKRIIQTLIFGALLAAVIWWASLRRGLEPILFLGFPVIIAYFLVLYYTPLTSTAVKLCKKRPDDKIYEVLDEEMFGCTH